MEFRTLGRTGLKVSAISLGTEYLLGLPREHMAAVVHEAIRSGVNYFDLFFANPTFRDNMGLAFAGQRQAVFLAAHLGAIETNGQSDRTNDVLLAERYFNDFLERYHTDYVDVLFLHNVDLAEDYAAVMGSGGLRDLALRLRRAGKARAIGFSGHTVATARQVVESGDVDVLMFPVNLAGDAIPGREGLCQACADRGVGLVAMKPYAGGRLLRPEHVLALQQQQGNGEQTPVEGRAAITAVQCLAYVLAQTGVCTVVPGCQDLAQLAAAQAYWTASAEEKAFAPILSAFADYRKGECVYCNHCLPCPVHIDIGKTIYLLETASQPPRGHLLARQAPSAPASACVECGACDARCPFGVGPMAKVLQAAGLPAQA
ncbi:MAG: aldo/keto reductase [Chloroflexota bacterium]